MIVTENTLTWMSKILTARKKSAFSNNCQDASHALLPSLITLKILWRNLCLTSLREEFQKREKGDVNR
jgi:hypothetical protein|uniref:Uncharacterized protein n=1 Tax=Populus trichocarpa TaxID=3694 RepID=U5FG77_POPTR